MICPFDMKPCIDDLCYGGGCLRMEGEPMLERCPHCKQLVASDGSEPCECEEDWDDEWEDEDE